MSLAPLVGHERVLSRLGEALDRGRLAHALLFAGPAGVGKFLGARHLAARIACSRADPRPCGDCDACVQLAAGTHPDVALIAVPPGKKEIGIDLIRQLKRFIYLHAITAARKIAIIDEADRLSLSAQNALLKTLEEPPLRSLLILITSTPHALLPTVRSRCQMVRFQPLALDEVATVLEHNGLDAEQAMQLAATSDGSPGRALQLRELLRHETLHALEDSLAVLDGDRYVSIVRLAKALAGNQQEMMARLEWLQSWYGRRAAAAVRNRPAGRRPPDDRAFEPGVEVGTALRAVATVGGAIRTLQRRNPNRPLLAESLALRLASR